MSEGRDRRQSLQSLERGIAVIQVFSRERPALTLSEVARMTGITRATARRILLTLEEVGHVRSDGRLLLAHPARAVAGLGLPVVAEPVGDGPAADGGAQRAHQRVLLGRHPRPARRRLRGAHADAADHDHLAGRRLAAARALHLDRARPARRPARRRARAPSSPAAELEAFTEHTITDRARLRAAIDTVRAEGWALVDQELEIGLRSISAPLRVGGATIAAINLAAAAPRVPVDELRGVMLPELRRTAELISAALER